MDEAEKLCDRIAFVDKGRLVALDILENLKRLIPAGDLIEIGYETIDDRLVPAIRELGLINSVQEKEQVLSISAKNGSRVLPEIVAVFEKLSIPMNSISIHSPSLEDVFIYLTGRKLDDSGNQDIKPTIRGRLP
jgi:ABC-2 type transport system ATP-binding protein